MVLLFRTCLPLKHLFFLLICLNVILFNDSLINKFLVLNSNILVGKKYHLIHDLILIFFYLSKCSGIHVDLSKYIILCNFLSLLHDQYFFRNFKFILLNKILYELIFLCGLSYEKLFVNLLSNFQYVLDSNLRALIII